MAVAVLAAAALNLALLAGFGYNELLTPQVRMALWVGLGLVWAAAAVFSLVVERRRNDSAEADKADGPFGEATEHYLKGNWFEAERILTKMLHKNPRDLEARLMLATMLRHTARLDEATTQLDTLKRLEGARKWEWEIENECDLLAEAGSPADQPTEEQATTDSTGSPPAEHAA